MTSPQTVNKMGLPEQLTHQTAVNPQNQVNQMETMKQRELNLLETRMDA